MTDLELQQAIAKELVYLTDHHSLKKLNGEDWKDYHIYIQDKPYKDDEDDDAQEDYIIVMIDDEDTNENGDWIVQIHIIISICLYEESHQGNIILANMMNVIDLHLSKVSIINGKYEMEKEKHKRFNHECYPNYYECDYITTWKLPAPRAEFIEGFI